MNARAVDREHQTFEAIPASARSARQFVGEKLRLHGASAGVVSDYSLAVSELASNIIEHGDGSSLNIYVDVAERDWWEVEVVGGAMTAPDQMQHPDAWKVAGSDDPSGRGLGIVRHLMDDIVTVVTGSEISIRCRKRRDAA
jgi:anti-sigma regulatory factor (Ser/Thr protein kinase)